MISQDNNPLTDEHCRICNNILNAIPQAIELAKTCIDCGYPAQELLQTLEQQQRQAQTIKSRFFPHMP